ncbi:MAG: SGNH/GDSL hydrolase family protein [Candidatus Omnitrophica bacterium]|nr:SGNH/GDSL hydrolase family protein [Candidatus Omnitrophota bacterium]MCA9434218.1 SGNH/GDSL hydrolase family protein [Candidatus Omnitrophota bacterium]MCB9769869.1 SGNH/GDSL hydrolase family protein [Candidatus Omnitrophota bacterium]MCB9782144.1 SGNH/GDSL hydrolase family protein [Candidatus Omnitrophota bacterium]
MNDATQTYLALGDSMSIDDYTGVKGGGAVNQFHQSLGESWRLIDRTFDGATMPRVHERIAEGSDLVTLTIGGNDLLVNQSRYLSEGLGHFGEEHSRLLSAIREKNRSAVMIVGNVYAPQSGLSMEQERALDEANRLIGENVQKVQAQLADIHGAFLGHENKYLCLEIEPTLAGAKAIAALFRDSFQMLRGG